MLKQEIDLQPKEKRKDEFRKRRTEMEAQHEGKERTFLGSLTENHDLALRRLSEKHRDRLATIDKNFLQQKQTVSHYLHFPNSFLVIVLLIRISGHANKRGHALGGGGKTDPRETSAVQAAR